MAALEAAPHSIQGGRYSIGSQFHFYMEPQVRSLNPNPVTVRIFVALDDLSCLGMLHFFGKRVVVIYEVVVMVLIVWLCETFYCKVLVTESFEFCRCRPSWVTVIHVGIADEK